ncbi:MAG: hypothetical protein HQK97_07815 [Nitrospirae bacterium]|nr:hypothetical protein [Nitrospirota bacterium]
MFKNINNLFLLSIDHAQTRPQGGGTVALAVCLLSLLSCALVLSTSYIIPDAAYNALSIRHFSMPAHQTMDAQDNSTQPEASSSSCVGDAMCTSCVMCDDCGSLATTCEGCSAADACTDCGAVSCDCAL